MIAADFGAAEFHAPFAFNLFDIFGLESEFHHFLRLNPVQVNRNAAKPRYFIVGRH